MSKYFYWTTENSGKTLKYATYWQIRKSHDSRPYSIEKRLKKNLSIYHFGHFLSCRFSFYCRIFVHAFRGTSNKRNSQINQPRLFDWKIWPRCATSFGESCNYNCEFEGAASWWTAWGLPASPWRGHGPDIGTSCAAIRKSSCHLYRSACFVRGGISTIQTGRFV